MEEEEEKTTFFAFGRVLSFLISLIIWVCGEIKALKPPGGGGSLFEK